MVILTLLTIETAEQLVELEERWVKILKDVTEDKKKLIVLKNKNKENEKNANKKGVFKRMIEIVTGNKVKGQEELERLIRGSQIIQEETYMSTLYEE